jgi:hypothetical protein
MHKDVAKDRLATHAITNYLLAGYQGRFTFLNILSQLNFPSLNQGLITETRQSIDKIALWTEELWKGNDLFSATWNSPQTFDSQEALRLLDNLKPELYSIANEIARIVQAEDISQRFDDIVFLGASFGRFAYARENYIKGFLEFGQRFNVTHETNRYAALLPPAQEDVKLTHQILNVLRARTDATNPEFISGLLERCAPLVSVFRTHVHDINQLLGTYQGGFSFEKGDFTQQEAVAWKQIGMGPVAAGYWRASGFSAQDAEPWLVGNIANPPTAAAWRTYGFNADTAAQWIQQGFPPAFAKMWFKAGFDAVQTKAFVDQGILEPSKVPPSR